MEFITKNGQKAVEINTASFKDAANLKKAAMRCLLDVSKANNIDINNLLGIEMSGMIQALLQLIINLDTSDEFEKAVMECLKCCIYDKGGKTIKITPTLFDDIPEAREDYYDIVAKCCEENLRPFFKSLVSEFKTRFNHLTDKLPEQK